jgi:ferrochelatase
MNFPGLTKRKTKIVFVQLGSPKSPETKDVRTFLKNFLSDKRVIDLNPIFWKIILYLFVLPFRPKRSGALYKRIWNGTSFPLIDNTKSFTEQVEKSLDQKQSELVEYNHAFLLSSPKVSDLKESNKPATRLIVIPMFPQYAESTVASGMDAFFKELEHRVKIPPFEFITDFHRSKAFIDNSVRLIETKLFEFKANGGVDALMISFHGIPKRRVIEKEDPYFIHCYETFRLLQKNVKGISEDRVHISFQSRFGSEEWLTPYTEDVVEELAKAGHKKIAVYCPSFVADCLETIDEIGTELREEAKVEHGADILFIPCLNDDKKWCEDFAKFTYTLAEGTHAEREENLYTLEKDDYKMVPEVKMTVPPLTTEAKSSLKIVFLTLFLDLVGFSIIFPLFPAMAAHYLAVDSENFFLKLIFGGVEKLLSFGGEGAGPAAGIVLFGGILGALYSFCQFVAAPLWGRLSDRIGRRPVLMISVGSLALSYLLWFFSGSFTLLILSRFFGGIMGGNISTATAVAADVTTKENRAKGMAVIGIAFALGFILGPALGGIFAMFDLTKMYPVLADYGVNPFSVPALIAFLLSAYNFMSIKKRFKETLPPEKRGKTEEGVRTSNPLKLFKPLPYKGVNLVNIGHFLFLAAFSGMEFTLTFLAVERLAYSPMDNAKMFIFIGFIIALVQGGVVRRKAHQVGEKKMALMGLITLIPGLLIISGADTSFMIYLGLFFLSVGSAMAIPCLTSLVSILTPSEVQGTSIGIFRSLGALARVVGPITASLLYWRFGGAAPYVIGSAFLLIPILMISMLKYSKEDQVA